MKNDNDEFAPEGDYCCTNCKRLTKHEYLAGIGISLYESLSLKGIIDKTLGTPKSLTCTKCFKPYPS